MVVGNREQENTRWLAKHPVGKSGAVEKVGDLVRVKGVVR